MKALRTAVLFLLVCCRSAAPAGESAPEIVRTASPAARGLTDQDFPRVQKLAEGIYSYEQLRSAGDERFTTVSLFVVTQEGVLVADGQGNVEETRRMVETIRGITNRPITHVVICSDHGDHTGGNSAFPATAAYLVHPKSAAVLTATANRSGGAGNTPRTGTPMELVSDRKQLRLGGKQIDILFLGRAHTGGDLVVYLPAEKILFMSEAYLNRVFPAMRSAYPSEWVAVIDKALAMAVDIYVPGHGFVDPPRMLEEELRNYRRALQQVIAEGRRLHAAGLGVEQAVQQARFGDLESWTLRASQGAIAIRRVYLEVTGELR